VPRPTVGGLQQGLAAAENVEELLGFSLRRGWPKAHARPAGHDDDMKMGKIHKFLLFFKKLLLNTKKNSAHAESPSSRINLSITRSL